MWKYRVSHISFSFWTIDYLESGDTYIILFYHKIHYIISTERNGSIYPLVTMEFFWDKWGDVDFAKKK